MISLKFIAIGQDTGVVMPKEMLSRLAVKEGDDLAAFETPHGYLLSAHDPAAKEQLKVGREFAKEYRETLKSLA